MTLKPQLWIDHDRRGPPHEDKFTPARGNSNFKGKPDVGGFWTSTHTDQDCWLSFCSNEGWWPGGGKLSSFEYYLLEVSPDARVYEIDNYDDLHKLYERFIAEYDDEFLNKLSSLHALDLTKISQEYDGIHLTSEGQWATRLSDPYNLYGWDCESTLWLNWRFTKISKISYEKAIEPISLEVVDG